MPSLISGVGTNDIMLDSGLEINDEMVAAGLVPVEP
jgi:hypothetical protein